MAGDGQSVSLKEFVERIFAEREKALDITANALHEKLQEMNQFRLQLEQERALYVKNKDLEPLFDRIRKLEDRGSNLDGRFWALGIGLTLLTSGLSLALHLWFR